MQKLRLRYFEKIKSADLSAAEIDYLIYISRYQSTNGYVVGVYYKDVCAALNWSYQTFYNVQSRLQNVGLISCTKKAYSDWDVQLVGNDCSDIQAVKEEGYLNTGRNIFLPENFLSLKAKEKIMAMELMKRVGAARNRDGSAQIGKKKFYEKYAEILQVTTRMVKQYMRSLKRFFWFYLQDKVYFLTPKKKTYQKPSEALSEVFVEKRNQVIAAARRCKMKNVGDQDIDDVARLYQQYKTEIPDNLNFEELLQEQLRRDNAGQKKIVRRRLLPKLVHLILKEKIKLQTI